MRRDEAGLQAAREFAHNEMNGSGALVRLAGLSETAFATSAAGNPIKNLRVKEEPRRLLTPALLD